MARKASRKAKRGTKRKQKHGGAKPRKQWSAAYRKRIEAAERKGLSRQAARGHHVKEHVTRKQAAGLTAGQSHSIDAFARKQAHRAGSKNPDEAARLLKVWARENGMGRFRQLQAEVTRLSKLKRQRSRIKVKGKKAVAYISTGGNVADMQGAFEDFELPDMPDADDFAWLFYH
jgi:hypothetical protein